jgi:hypothetical protein
MESIDILQIIAEYHWPLIFSLTQLRKKHDLPDFKTISSV